MCKTCKSPDHDWCCTGQVCGGCKSTVSNSAKFCPECGRKMSVGKDEALAIRLDAAFFECWPDEWDHRCSIKWDTADNNGRGAALRFLEKARKILSS